MPLVSALASSIGYRGGATHLTQQDQELRAKTILVVLLAVFTATACTGGSVGLCPTASLSTYLSYNGLVCTIGDLTLSNFAGFISAGHFDGVSPGLPSGSYPGFLPDPASLIMVVPTDIGNVAGLSFQAPFYAQGFQGSEVLLIGYQVSALASDPLIGAGISLSGTNTSSEGVLRGSVELCENGSYGSVPQLPLPCSAGSVLFNPAGTPQITTANQTAVFETSFDPSTSVDVLNSLSLFGQPFDFAGASALNTVLETAGARAGSEAPETGSMILMAAGLLALSGVSRLVRMRAARKRSGPQ
jgi:hypothetical protein